MPEWTAWKNKKKQRRNLKIETENAYHSVTLQGEHVSLNSGL
jgi:hypothetical protein